MIAEALAQYAKATARLFEGRENTVGASEVGQCSRKIYFAKNSGDRVYGADADEDYAEAWGAALRGRLIEDHFWLPALRARYGDKLLYAGVDQRTLVSGFLSATPDGLLIEQHDVQVSSVVVKCKSIDPRGRFDDVKPEHAFQAIVQIGLICELTPYRPEAAIISYINASFLDDVIEFVVYFDPAVFQNAELSKAYGKHIRQHPDEDPIVELDGGSYPHRDKSIGRVKVPVFNIVGWTRKGPDDTDKTPASEPPKSPAPTTAAAKPATTSKSQPHF